MKNWIAKSSAAVISMALLTGCWASKEETSSQLQQHLKAYQELKISPGNAQSTIKSIDLLLTPSDSNNFAKLISTTQGEMLRSAKRKAEEVLQCKRIGEAANEMLSSKAWEIKNIDNNTSSHWKSRLHEIERAAKCGEDVKSLMSEDESKTLATLAKETSNRYQQVLNAEKAKEEEARRAKEEMKRAQERRVNAFFAKTGMDPYQTGYRAQINESMLRVVRKNCEDWLPGSCEREYGLTLADFDYIRSTYSLRP